ncbi:DUF302 domain-containing protein [bacterium]|nr:DUF302 domain-containing protein [bacterium]
MMKKTIAVLSMITVLSGCSKTLFGEKEYVQADRYASTIINNIEDSTHLSNVVTIDHSRLANQAGAPLAPSQVIMFHDTQLESELLAKTPLIALNLPLKVLVYQDDKQQASIIWNQTTYLENRHNINFTEQERRQYNQDIQRALQGIEEGAFRKFANNEMTDNATITINSDIDFRTTVERALKVVGEQKDVTIFEKIDYQAIAKEHNIVIKPTFLIMYGAPNPGGKAMKEARTLGLDAFPQKLLVWEAPDGTVKVTYNNLSLLADRQDVHKPFALLMIQKRINWHLNDSFEKEAQ